MNQRLVRLCVIAGCAALVTSAPVAGATVLKAVPGTVTAVAADGTNVAYVTNINSKACPAPIVGDRQQVVYLNARTRKSVILTTEKGCESGDGPGLFVTANRWLAITGKKHVFWIEGGGGNSTYTGINVATPGSKPVRGAQSAQGDRGFGSVYGPLVAWGGRGYANLTGYSEANIDACNGFTEGPACAIVVAGDQIRSFDAAGTAADVVTNAAPWPKQIQAASGNGALLLDPNGALSLAKGSTSTSLAGSLVDQAAMSDSRIVGLRHAGAKVRLRFWSTSGTQTGNCTSAPGRSTTPGLAIAGRVAAFATARGIFAMNAPSGRKTACRAAKIVALHRGEKLAGFALTTTGGLIYATNTGTKTIRGIVAQLTPKQLAHRGFRISGRRCRQ